MKLIDYPQEIEKASKEFLMHEQKVQELQQQLEKLRHTIQSQVFFDSTLKNQNQRDVRLAELLYASQDYQDISIQLKEARHERNLARIHLDCLRNQFSSIQLSILAKLEFLNRVETPQDIRVHLAGMGIQGLFTYYSTTRYVSPEEAATQITAFVEAVVNQLQTTDSLWVQGIDASEFYPDEPDESDESEFNNDEPAL